MVHDIGYDADDDSDLQKDDLLDFETSDCLKDLNRHLVLLCYEIL